MQSFFLSLVSLFRDAAYGAILVRDQLLFALDTAYLSPYVLLFFSFGLLFFFLLQIFFIRLHIQNIHALFQRESALQRNSEKHIQRQLFVLIEELRQYNTRKSTSFLPQQPIMPPLPHTAGEPLPSVDLRSIFRTKEDDRKTTHVAAVVDDALIPASVISSPANASSKTHDDAGMASSTSSPMPPKPASLQYNPALPTYIVSPKSVSPSAETDDMRTFVTPSPIFSVDSKTSPFADHDDSLITDVVESPASPTPSNSPSPARGIIEFEEIRRQMHLLSTDSAKIHPEAKVKTEAFVEPLSIDPKSFAFVPPSNTANS